MTRCIAPRGAGDRTPCPDPREPGSLFCRAHEQAPASQRGGWLSAEQRRRRLAASQDHTMDASNVATRLWVGGQPPFDRDLPDFDVLVLCAGELQPEQVAFHGRLIRCPIPDAVLNHAELTRALLTSKAVADAMLRRQRILVTCAMGINRSALVASLAIARVTSMSAEDLVRLMRQRRHPMALSNPTFQHILQRLVGDGRRYR